MSHIVSHHALHLLVRTCWYAFTAPCNTIHLLSLRVQYLDPIQVKVADSFLHLLTSSAAEVGHFCVDALVAR